MSKTVKSIAIGALVGFITGGAGFFAKAAFSSSLKFTAAAALAKAKVAAIYGAIGAGLSSIAATIAKPNMDMNATIGRQNISIDPQALGAWVFGETPAATDIVFSEQIGDEKIVHVVAAAAHEIASYGEMYINDEQVTFAGQPVGEWADVLQVYAALGTQPQTPVVVPESSWDGGGSGVAHYALKWDASGDNAEKIEGGIPTRITRVVKGSKVYDPRLDDTRGGTGSHRADDQSTWEWSDNWALIVAHYLLGYYNNDKLVYGVGVNPDDIDWLQVAAMANVCDETVDDKPRYRVGGIIPTSNDHESVIGQLEAAIGGKVSRIGGKYYIWCPHNDLISQGTITNDNILRETGVTFTPTAGLADLFNTARGRFVDADTIYQPATYPEVSESAAIAEDGRERLMERDFSIIQDQSIAERVAREMVRRSRFSATWTLALGPEGLLYQPFDVVTLNCDETDFQDQLVRIVSMEYSPDGIVVMTLLEEDASIYDITIPLGTPVTQLSPDSYDPTQVIPVTGLAATAISVTGSGGTVSDAFQVSWDNPGPFVRDTEVRYRTQGASDYSYVQATGLTSAVITPVEPDTVYEIEARHITRENVKSPFVAITATSGDTSRGRAINGLVDYQQINTWRYDPQDDTILPNNPDCDAVFRFKRGTSEIATRTVRATIDTATGNITVNDNLATTGEATSVVVTGNGTQAVIVRVLHDASGVEVAGQFQTIESVPANLSPIQDELDQLESDLDTLNNTTLPNLQNELDQANQDLATLDGKFPITSTDISPGAIKTPQLDANAVTAEKILAGEITTDKMTVNSINGDRITTNTLDGDKITVNTLNADRITSNTITSDQISGNTLDVLATNTGTLTANLIRTAANGQRLEIADPGTDPDYAIWIGNFQKNDTQGVFYVKHNGEAFINKNEFDISDGGIITGAFSNAGGTVQKTFNNLVADNDGNSIFVGQGGIAFEVNMFYQGLQSTQGESQSQCDIPFLSGAITLERANNSSFTSGLTTVGFPLTFDFRGSNFFIEDPVPANNSCLQRIVFDNTKSFTDSPTPGTYFYRLRYSSWDLSFDAGAFSTTQNVIYATFTSSAA